MAKVKFERKSTHVSISEIGIKEHNSNYEKRFAEHMKQLIVSGSKTYNLTSKEAFDMYNCPEIMEKEEL